MKTLSLDPQILRKTQKTRDPAPLLPQDRDMAASPETILRDWLPQAWKRCARQGLTPSEGGWLLFSLAIAFFAPNFLRGSLWWCPERAAGMGILLALPVGLLPPIFAMEARALKATLLALAALDVPTKRTSKKMKKRKTARQDPCKETPGPGIAGEAARLDPAEREELVRRAAAALEPLLAGQGFLRTLLVLGPLLPGFVLLLLRTPDLTTWIVLVAGIALSFHQLLKLQARALKRAALVRELACLTAAAWSEKTLSQNP